MMIMTTGSVCSYLKDKFPDIAHLFCNGHLKKNENKSIGVFLGSETRANPGLAIGGIDCTVVKYIPVNIHIIWSENQAEHDTMVTNFYKELLLEGNNFYSNDIKVACIELIDGTPRSLGRNERNVCESIIRANFHYYV